MQGGWPETFIGERVAPATFMKITNLDRREFWETALAAAGLTATAGGAPIDTPHPNQTRKGDMLYRDFGRTGETVSVIGVGGSHIGQTSSDDLAIRIIRTAVDRGVNF